MSTSSGNPVAVAEPGAALSARPALALFLATRPAFLSLTLLGVPIGWACTAHLPEPFNMATAAVTLLFALVAHAGANVINDFHDVATDALNLERIYPFTGGSRFIQNRILTARRTAWLGYSLLLLVIPAGLWLVAQVGSGLLLLGLIGLFVAWAYSAPPLRLSARGLGEIADRRRGGASS